VADTAGNAHPHPLTAAAYRLTIRRRVVDVEDWQRGVSGRMKQLRLAGLVGYELYRVAGDPHETELVLEFATLAEAEAVARLLDLPESRERVLLAGAMEIGSMWLVERVAAERFSPPGS
jgi:hypothetical protein